MSPTDANKLINGEKRQNSYAEEYQIKHVGTPS